MKTLRLLLLPLFCAPLFACSGSKSTTPPPAVAPITSETTDTSPVEAPLAVNTPNIYEYTSGPQGNLSVHIYSEDGIWIVDQNLIDVDGLPTPQARWIFTTKEKAYAHATKNLGITEADRNDTALDQEGIENTFFTENLNSGDGLWKATNTWNWQWEIAFAKWTRANLKPSFFQDLGIENDCADAYYQARMIFAYENALPVSFRLAGGGAYFTQKTMRPEWKKLKTDKDWRKNKQFLKSLDYIANTTYTHTLGRDTYPVEMSKEGLLEGTAYLSLGETSGHTLIVNEINVNETATTRLPMYTLNSTVPKTVRPLYESMFYTSVQPQKSKYGVVGFVRFRWPKSSGASALVEAKDMPYYSEEQYDPAFLEPVSEENPDYKDFSITVFRRLNPNFDPALRIVEGIAEVGQMVEARKEVIVEGYAVCSKGCAEGSADYENWSTPSRDKRIVELITDLERYQSALSAFPALAKAWKDALVKDIVELDGAQYVFAHLKWTFQNSFFSSDPNQSPAIRWGLSPVAFAQSSFNAIGPMLGDRNTKVNTKTQCLTSPTCTVFSEEYVSNATFTEDQKIQNAVAIRNQYCETVGETKCAEFQTALGTHTTVVPGHKSFLDTWNSIYVLNSDPRVPEAQRWGKMPDFLETLLVDGSLAAQGRYKNKFLLTRFTHNVSSTYYYDILLLDVETKSVSKIGQSYDTTAIVINEVTGKTVIADIHRKILRILDLNTQETQDIDVASLPVDSGFASTQYYSGARWLNDSQFSLSYANNLALFKTQSDGTFTIPTVLEKFHQFGQTPFAFRSVNLASESTSQTDYEVTVVNTLDDSQSPLTFRINDVIGNIYPTYLSFDGTATNDAILVTWSKYSEAQGSQEGRIIANLKTGKVTTTKEFKTYISPLKLGLVTASEYDSQTEKSYTAIYFLNDDFSIKKMERISGSCANCYDLSSNFITIGSTIYAIDLASTSLKKAIEITGFPAKSNVSFGSLYGKYAIVNFSDANLYYNVLFDLEKNQPLMVSESLNMNSSSGFYPTVTSSSSYQIPGPEGQEYYSMNLVLDMDNIGKGPIATPMYYGGGESYYEGEEGASEVVFKVPSVTDIPLSVNVIDPSAIQPADSPASLILLGDKKTVIIFK